MLLNLSSLRSAYRFGLASIFLTYLIGQGYCLVRTIHKHLAYMPNVLAIKNGIKKVV
jgi:hypothetical protein